MLDWQQTSQPVLVHNTASVDVVKASAARVLCVWGVLGVSRGGRVRRGCAEVWSDVMEKTLV